ncbi:hypothetical protein CP98_01521 [Sphingobium yanoikuyae]|uniref:Uncharacterized protein n=2 Tax=Sphingomonadaceae TaxID=41297 RepID=A0A084EPH9_SPHYA|nr:hypothetical protein BV97_04913 [Novosphingobium resinovorum]KEZ19871.1 hypothetical protein CP98_01521 [Sphingobium yanoikuyae]
MLDLPPATLNPRATHDPCRNLADYALREAVRSTAKKCLLMQPRLPHLLDEKIHPNGVLFGGERRRRDFSCECFCDRAATKTT